MGNVVTMAKAAAASGGKTSQPRPRQSVEARMTFDGDAFGTAVAEMIRDFVGREIKKLRADLELRLKALEESDAIPYQGTYENDRQYQRGQFVTFNGSLWHANKTTKQSPGSGSSDWQLAVKRGRDGKDAKQ